MPSARLVILFAAGLTAFAALQLGCAETPARDDSAADPGAQREPPASEPAARPEAPQPGTRPARGVAEPGARAVAVAVPVGSKRAWVDANEVTVGAFEACVAAGACAMEHVTVIPDSTCNYEAKGRESHPMNCVDWYGAEQYCRHAGARLCAAEEWFSACRGAADQDYPYGASYDPAACNVVATAGPLAEHGTVAVGSASSCEGGYPGLHDMVGNVSEWVDACNGDYCKFYGGAFTTNEPLADFASCKQFCAGNKKAFRSSTIGIRCCRDDAPDGQ